MSFLLPRAARACLAALRHTIDALAYSKLLIAGPVYRPGYQVRSCSADVIRPTLISSAFSMNPGRCFILQVGVKAPGTANNTTFFPLHNCSVPNSFMLPSLSKYLNFASGNFSPTATAYVRMLLALEIAAGLIRCCSTLQPLHNDGKGGKLIVNNSSSHIIHQSGMCAGMSEQALSGQC